MGRKQSHCGQALDDERPVTVTNMRLHVAPNQTQNTSYQVEAALKRNLEELGQMRVSCSPLGFQRHGTDFSNRL